MNICFSLSNLELGGAQVFVTRLASNLAAKSAHRVFIYDHQPELRNRQLASTVSRKVKLVSYCEGRLARWFVWKLNALMSRLGITTSFRNWLNRKRFSRFLAKNHIHILNSHMSFSDFVISSVPFPETCRFIPSLHGEYELLLKEEGMGSQFRSSIARALDAASMVIYTADKNLEPLAGRSLRLQKIGVGFDKESLPHRKIERAAVGLAGNDFIAGMVSRGIPDKGWDTAIAVIQACNKMCDRPIKLVLIGDGAYLPALVAQVNDENITHLVFEDNYTDYYAYYQLFDVFLFPTRFPAESVPNVVIESLSWNVPVIATRQGEIPAMIEEGSARPAGITVPPDGGVQSRLAEVLVELYRDRQKLLRLSENCSAAFSKFSMQRIANEYIHVFGSLMDVGNGQK